MSNKLKSSSASVTPIKRRYVRQARTIAEQYQLVIWFEDDEYFGRGVELPYAFGEGKTIEQCARNTREAFVTAVAGYLQEGNSPPAPAHEGKRDQQLNIRLSSQERLLLETKARQSGATGISEYVRAVALRGGN
jgi:predicted RNase H-like HicB family nuclease